MRGVIYARKSTSKFGQKETIDNQIKICKRRAEELGIEIVDIKIDTGTGTDDNNRPEVKEMIADAVAGKYECVIMKGISRLYRDTENGLGLIKKLDRSKVRVVTVEEGFDTLDQRTGNGQLDTSRITMYLMFAELESKKTGDRIKYTQIEKAHLGQWNQVSSIPIGYVYDKETKKLDLDKSEKAETVRLIFKLYLDGMGMRSIAQYLNGENPQGKVYATSKSTPEGNENFLWSQHTISFILKNRVYVGDIIFNKRSKTSRPYKNPESIGKDSDDVYIGNDYNEKEKWIITPNAHPPLISEEIFNKVQKIISNKSVRSGVKNGISLLAGLAKCKKCGKGMTFKKGRRDSKGRVSTKDNYYCSEYIKYGKRYCTSHHMGAVEFEGVVLEKLQDAIDSRLNLKDATSNLKTNKNPANVIINKIKKLEKDIDQVTKKTDVILTKNIDGDITNEQFNMMNKKYNQELKHLVEELEKAKLLQQGESEDKTSGDFLRRKYDEVKNIKTLPKERQRYVLMDLIDIITFNDGVIEIQYSF